MVHIHTLPSLDQIDLTMCLVVHAAMHSRKQEHWIHIVIMRASWLVSTHQNDIVDEDAPSVYIYVLQSKKAMQLFQQQILDET